MKNTINAAKTELIQKRKGLYQKFIVTRSDGKSKTGEKHDNCEYFVLDLSHDKHSAAAIQAYIISCEKELPKLAHDLRVKHFLKKQ